MRFLCSVIVEDDNPRRLLLIRDPMGAVPFKWNQPHGNVEGDETPWQTAVRVVKQATGFDIELVALQRIHLLPKIDRYDINICYVARVIAPQTDEIADAPTDEFKWFTLAELEQMSRSDFRHKLAIKRIHDWKHNVQYHSPFLEISSEDTQ